MSHSTVSTTGASSLRPERQYNVLTANAERWRRGFGLGPGPDWRRRGRCQRAGRTLLVSAHDRRGAVSATCQPNKRPRGHVARAPAALGPGGVPGARERGGGRIAATRDARGPDDRGRAPGRGGGAVVYGAQG